MTPDDEPDEGSPPQPMLTVAAVARRLGVAPSTLRTWDRRYGLGPSAHTAGSHRRYSAADLSRLVVMRGLTMEGVPPAEAAQIALGGSAPAAGLPFPAGRTLAASAQLAPATSPVSSAVVPPAARSAFEWAPVLPAIPVAREPDQLGAELADLDRQLDRSLDREFRPLLSPSARTGGGRVISLPDGSPQARGLARAAMSLDTAEIGRLLRDALASHGVVATWETMAMPVLQAIGERWRVTGDGIDVEHAFSEAVLTAMCGLAASVRRPRNSRPVLLACAEDDHHTLPLHVLAAALAEEEIGCRMLGVGMPADALIAAVRRTGPAVVFAYARQQVADAGVLAELRRQRPAPRIVIGGPGWSDEHAAGAVLPVATLGAALDAVLSAVQI